MRWYESVAWWLIMAAFLWAILATATGSPYLWRY